MNDALAVYPDNKVLLKTAMSPLLSPNQAPMSGYVVIDAQEKPDFIRAKATSLEAMYYGQGGNEFAYVYLKLTNKSVNYSPEKMRIGGQAVVTGKYIQNIQYKTIAGEQKTAPVLEVMYIKPL